MLLKHNVTQHISQPAEAYAMEIPEVKKDNRKELQKQITAINHG